ncbi:helix-turn-helix domain-containing protein, partial [Patescibacteria group bacterium]|nr:helix-turn-helix domain-containing protein [Patescibacteria group bacterium]
MNLETSLIQFGLNSKEASVYLAALELGGSPVLKIAKKAELKRPTVYL